MSSTTKVYLVTGANRGIGYGLVDAIASKHTDIAIFAGVRDVASKGIVELSAKHPGKIIPIKYVSADLESNQAIAKIIEEKFGKLDVLVQNAAMAYVQPMIKLSASDFHNHMDVNVWGALLIFQATVHLLQASSSPRFIPISSGQGSLTAYLDRPYIGGAYGVSKVALNYVARKIHFENPWLTSFPLAPGAVKTDMAAKAAQVDSTGGLADLIDEIGLSIDVASRMLLEIIDNATREKDGGQFVNIDGQKLPW